MASQYYAVNRILHGTGDGEKVFEAGDQVTGLDEKAMVALWAAGVLTEVNPNERSKDDRDERIAQLEQELAELKAQTTPEGIEAGVAETEPPVDREKLDEFPGPDSEPVSPKVKTAEGAQATGDAKPAPAPAKATPAKAAPTKAATSTKE
jgi:hypothetical protein